MKHIYITLLLLIGISNSTFSQLQTFYSSYTDPTGHFGATQPSYLVSIGAGFTNLPNLASGNNATSFATYNFPTIGIGLSVGNTSVLSVGTAFNLFQYLNMKPNTVIKTQMTTTPGLLNLGVLGGGGVTLKTYTVTGYDGTPQNNRIYALQETATSGSGGLLSINLLGLGSTDQYNLSFTATQPFDSVAVAFSNSLLGVSLLGQSINFYQFSATGIPDGVTLPVNLSSFTSAVKNNAVVLNWATALENNNSGFYVERSTDNKTFSSLGFVKSQAVNGNSTSLLNYAFTDNSPSNGVNYYRLKQVDINNTSTYSATVSQTITNLVLKLFPNPAASEITISGAAANAQFVITNLLGQVVKTSNNPNMSVANLPAGIYLVQVNSNGGNKVLKFIKQ